MIWLLVWVNFVKIIRVSVRVWLCLFGGVGDLFGKDDGVVDFFYDEEYEGFVCDEGIGFFCVYYYGYEWDFYGGYCCCFCFYFIYVYEGFVMNIGDV